MHDRACEFLRDTLFAHDGQKSFGHDRDRSDIGRYFGPTLDFGGSLSGFFSWLLGEEALLLVSVSTESIPAIRIVKEIE